MSVVIAGVEPHTPAHRARIHPGDLLLSINGNEIVDVLDYRFYQNERQLEIRLMTRAGEKNVRIRKGEYEELGLTFETYLMDQQHSCRNKCIFCFIDQLPKGLRESLYFKDDDSRLSFLFGNYITLTNITEHEVSRIIKMHISPINISVHTTDPELRVRMMRNRFAGQALEIIGRFAAAGIQMNCQLVLCPGINDGEALCRTLADLTQYESVRCIAAVPVGLTRFREGLEPLEPFCAETAGAVLDILDRFGEQCIERYGDRRVYGADEFYLLAGREIPEASYYGDFLQLENGVGLWSLLRSEAYDALKTAEPPRFPRRMSSVTGMAAYPLIANLVDMAEKKWHNLSCKVYPIVNNFFGGQINVTGLVTGGDIIDQLKDKDLGDILMVPEVMLRREGDLFLDDVSVSDLERALQVRVVTVPNDGYALIDTLAGLNDK